MPPNYDAEATFEVKLASAHRALRAASDASERLHLYDQAAQIDSICTELEFMMRQALDRTQRTTRYKQQRLTDIVE